MSSIKNLFNNERAPFKKVTKHVVSASEGVESNQYVEQKDIKYKRYVPPVDFSTGSHFAKFGSAELYYEFAFKRIYNQYPYDGTLAEKEEFDNKSTHLDRYIFDKVYPRTNGYVVMGYQGFGGSLDASGYHDSANKEYILTKGGIHTASTGMKNKPLADTFDYSMKYNLVSGSRQASSLECNTNYGFCIEFWMKKKAFDTTKATKEVIFDLWNQEPLTGSHYKRVTLQLNAKKRGVAPFDLIYKSGSVSNIIFPGSGSITTASIADNTWHHYAISMKKEGGDMRYRLYQDGTLLSEELNSNDIGEIKGRYKGLISTVGALSSKPNSSSSLGMGDGKLSASLDEFRYWKSERTPKQVGLEWFNQVGGGTNKYDSNKELGVYYKFNEGITGTSSYDSTVLDYAGRLTDGKWTGYTSGARSTGSAMVLSGRARTEFKDPILYSFHPDVSASMTQYKISGSLYDLENTSLFYNLLPSWIQEEDEDSNNNVKYLSQIMASYFDTLYSQISHFDSYKNKEYYDGKARATNTLAKHALREEGIVIPDLFIESEIIEKFSNKDVNEIYSGSIEDIKNMIYQNIYNNLLYIQKSKGTEKSFRNLFRCFGIDTELIKLNLYADNSTYVMRDNYEFKSVVKPVLNFHNEFNTRATVYQTGSIGLNYISGSEQDREQYSALTMECEFITPKKYKPDQTGFVDTPFATSSIFGYHRARVNPATSDDLKDLTWANNDTTIRVHALKDSNNSKHVRFRLTGGVGSTAFALTSPRYKKTYENEKWTLAARIKHNRYPFINISGTLPTDGYNLSLYGLCTVGNDIIKGPFEVSMSVSNTIGKRLLGDTKRMYVGAHRLNYTGSYREQSDVNVSQLRVWQSYLTDDVIKQHAYDPTNYGLDNLLRSDNIFQYKNIHVPQIETLALHWDFETVTGSDANGQFVVYDKSSGSYGKPSLYGDIGAITKRKYGGKGMHFSSSADKAVLKEFIYAAKKRNPENLYSSDGVKIIGNDEEAFFQDDDVNDNFYSFEKSPYSAISDEMINMFATVQEFNNIIGSPVNRYRHEYKDLKEIRQLFFKKVQNVPDPQKYFEYFKWIDASVSYAISQLVPASSRFADGIRNVVESHILERNKYVEKFPFVAQESPPPIASIKGINESLYNWETGHAPVHETLSHLPENQNCLWQKMRRVLTSSVPPKKQSYPDANNLRKNINKLTDIPIPTLYDIRTSTAYKGNEFKIRSMSRPYKFSGIQSFAIHGGTNYYVYKDRNLVHTAVRPFGPTFNFYGLNVPKNVITVGTGKGQGLIAETVCLDKKHPNHKEKYNFQAVFGEYAQTATDGTVTAISDNAEYKYLRKGIATFPMNFVSSSLDTGYQKKVSEHFSTNVVITNIHSDTVDRTNEVPMQGPFTETWVGGHQSRHVPLNKKNTSLKTEGGGETRRNLDDQYSRPEAWLLEIGEHENSSYSDGAIGIVPADYGADAVTNKYPDKIRQKAVRFREEHAKRPVNVRNIAHDKIGNRVGNYNKRNEYISIAAGRKEMNLAFRSHSNISYYLPETMRGDNGLPHTTHVMTLAAQTPHLSGNIFGKHSNRQPDNTIYRSYYGQGLYLNDTTLADTSFSGYTNGNGFSLSLWMMIPSGEIPQSGTQMLLSADDGSGNHAVDIYWASGNTRLVAQFRYSDNVYVNKSFLVDLDDGKWRHYVITFDGALDYNGGSHVADNLKLYINGVAQIQDAGGTDISSGTKAASDLRSVGQIDQIGDTDIKLYVDDIAIWDTYLNASGVSTLYNSGDYFNITSHPKATSFLVSYYTFDHGSDSTSTIQDNQGSNHLTVADSSKVTFVDGAAKTQVNDRTQDVVMEIMTGSFRNNTQKNETVFTTRFSAPGGIEIQSPAYLDVYAREYSVYNALSYRNLTVRGKSSGEANTIRVNDHLGKRDGLLTHLTRHQGKHGRDSVYGSPRVAQFNGADSYVQFGTATEWDAIIGNNTGGGSTQIMTISCWVHKTEDSGILRIVDMGNTDISFYIDNDEKLWFKTKWNGGTAVWWNTSAVITHNTWHHVVVTYDANATGNNAIIYVDGAQHAPTETGTAPAGAWDGIATEGCYIGGYPGSANAFIKYLDEFAIWNKALSLAEIKQIHTAGRRKTLNSVGFNIYNGLQLWYRMGDLDDNEHRFYDQSGNGRHSLLHYAISISYVDPSDEGDIAPAFVKNHRNRSKRLIEPFDNSSGIGEAKITNMSKPIFKNIYDNGFIQTPIPRSDFQYSWINETIRSDYNIYSGKQRVFGYAPYSGIVSSSYEVHGEKGYVPALTFPTASEIFGERK